ncbi:hypothetical protein HKX48_005371 [Thoreauomyces humboldtii]|nr:hypothetical protein HKX48_005371 [Thoreauomyces humboldtii]
MFARHRLDKQKQKHDVILTSETPSELKSVSITKPPLPSEATSPEDTVESVLKAHEHGSLDPLLPPFTRTLLSQVEQGADEDARRLMRRILRDSRINIISFRDALFETCQNTTVNPHHILAFAKLSLEVIRPKRLQLRFLVKLSESVRGRTDEGRLAHLQDIAHLSDALNIMASNPGVRKAVDTLQVYLAHACLQHEGLTHATRIALGIRDGNDGVTSVFNAIIEQHVAAGHVEKAERIVLAMKRNGIGRDMRTYAVLIDGLTKAAQLVVDGKRETILSRAQTFVDEADGGQNMSAGYYKAVVRLCAATGNREELMGAVGRMRDAGFHPDQEILNLIQRGVRGSDGSRASLNPVAEKELLKTLRRLTAGAVGSASDEESALMKKVAANPWGINDMLSTLARIPKSVQIWRIIQGLEAANCPLHIDTYNIYLKSLLLSRPNLQEVQKAVRHIAYLGLEWSSITYNTLISLYIKGGDMERANVHFRSMANDTLVTPDRFSYTTIIDGNAAKGDMATCDRIMQSMHARGVIPDLVVYHSLLKGYGLRGDAASLVRIIDEVTKQGLAVTTRTYNSVISGLAAGGFAELASWWKERMVRDGIPPDVYTFNNLLRLHVSRQDMNAADTVWKDMTAARVRPDRISYNTMLGGWAVADDAHKVHSLINEMKASDRTTPDHASCTILIGFHARRNDMAAARVCFQEWLDGTTSPNAEPFAAIIHAVGVLDKDLPTTLQYHLLLSRHSIPTTSTVQTSLMRAYDAASRRPSSLIPIIALWKRLVTRRDGCGVDGPAACVMLDACGFRPRSIDELERVWSDVKSSAGEGIRREEWSNVYTSYVEALVRLGKHGKAVDVLEGMKEEKVAWTEKIFDTCGNMLRARGAADALILRVDSLHRSWKHA